MTDERAVVPVAPVSAELMEKVLVSGNLKSLTAAERLDYYRRTCESLGLNPLTRPFDYLELQGKLILYARKDAAEQLRKNNHVSIIGLEKEIVNDTYVVTATARLPDGREDTDMGAATIKGLSGDALVNAMLKAITKAKRRVTLSICGLGMLDETEIETIPNARPVQVDTETGEIVRQPSAIPTASELARQAVDRGVVEVGYVTAWCHERGVKKINDAPERDRIELAHLLANKLAEVQP